MQSLTAGHEVSQYQDVHCILDQNRLLNYLAQIILVVPLELM